MYMEISFFREFCNKLEKGSRAIVKKDVRVRFFVFLLMSDMTNSFVVEKIIEREKVDYERERGNCKSKMLE